MGGMVKKGPARKLSKKEKVRLAAEAKAKQQARRGVVKR